MKHRKVNSVFCCATVALMLMGGAAAQDPALPPGLAPENAGPQAAEPALPEGLGGGTADAPALPPGLGDSTPALPPGLGESTPALPPGLSGEQAAPGEPEAAPRLKDRLPAWLRGADR